MGKPGLAITFVTPRELDHLRLIEKIIKRKISRKPNPTFNEAIEGRQRISVEKLMRAVEIEDTSAYKGIARELLEENDSVTLLSAALKLLTKEPNTDPVRLTEETPLVRKKTKPEYGRKPVSHYKHHSNKNAGRFHKKSNRDKKNRY